MSINSFKMAPSLAIQKKITKTNKKKEGIILAKNLFRSRLNSLCLFFLFTQNGSVN